MIRRDGGEMGCCASDSCQVGDAGVDRNGAEAYSRLFKAMGDERRILILESIVAEPGICACKLLERFPMSQSTLSHHMKMLCDAGLVVCEKQGRWAHYRICEQGFEHARSALDEMLGTSGK